MAVLEVLGVGLWAVLGILGVWMLVTGRKLPYDFPKWIREGWPLRVFGFLYAAVAVLLMEMALRGSVSADGVVLGYVSFGVALAFVLNRRRGTQRPGDPTRAR